MEVDIGFLPQMELVASHPSLPALYQNTDMRDIPLAVRLRYTGCVMRCGSVLLNGWRRQRDTGSIWLAQDTRVAHFNVKQPRMLRFS